MEKCFFIFGFGYTASYLAPYLSRQGFKIIATSRHPQQYISHQYNNYQLIDFYKKNEVSAGLRQSSHVLISTPPHREGDPVITHYRDELIKFMPQFQWIGYLSSSGVYGDHQGAWVDENATIHPQSIQAIARLKAEQAWINLAQNIGPIHLFRLAAIYGPYRNALSAIIKGKACSIYKKGQYFSRAHITDIVNIILASIHQPNRGSIYNIADDMPTSAQEVDEFAALLLNIDPLPIVAFSKAQLSSMTQGFYNANRRVSNKKIHEEFNMKLTYPSYRQGLTQLFQNKEY